jgi:putative ABC transport system permease protein
MLYETERELTSTAVLVTAAIATVSLIVGGIGIMNILLVSVSERTREIGIRRACGAKRRDIQSQFILESTLLTTIGGFWGVVLGILASLLVGQIVVIPIHIAADSVVVSIAFSTAIGLGFGFYPAYNARNLSPAEAIRQE